MKKIYYLLLLFIIVFASCTKNQQARNFGGTSKIELPANHILINATWKESNLWILVKDTTTNEVSLKEISSWGMVEGKIIFE